MIEKINGRWTVKYGKMFSIAESKAEAEKKLAAWKGEEKPIVFEDDYEDDYEDDGQPDEAQEWHDFDPDA